MSSSSLVSSSRPVRIALGAALAAMLAFASGCTVQPLYSQNAHSAYAPGGVMADLSSIVIKPVDNRPAQELRNHLIFGFSGGQGQPASPRYDMTLSVATLHEDGLQTQVGDDNRPSTGSVTMIADYVITEIATGKPVAAGKRQMTSSYDIPRQEFAAVRARRDADNRAARQRHRDGGHHGHGHHRPLRAPVRPVRGEGEVHRGEDGAGRVERDARAQVAEPERLGILHRHLGEELLDALVADQRPPLGGLPLAAVSSYFVHQLDRASVRQARTLTMTGAPAVPAPRSYSSGPPGRPCRARRTRVERAPISRPRARCGPGSLAADRRGA